MSMTSTVGPFNWEHFGKFSDGSRTNLNIEDGGLLLKWVLSWV